MAGALNGLLTWLPGSNPKFVLGLLRDGGKTEHVAIDVSVVISFTATAVEHRVVANLRRNRNLNWEFIDTTVLGLLSEDEVDCPLSDVWIEQAKEWAFKKLISPLQQLAVELSGLWEES